MADQVLRQVFDTSWKCTWAKYFIRTGTNCNMIELPTGHCSQPPLDHRYGKEPLNTRQCAGDLTKPVVLIHDSIMALLAVFLNSFDLFSLFLWKVGLVSTRGQLFGPILILFIQFS